MLLWLRLPVPVCFWVSRGCDTWYIVCVPVVVAIRMVQGNNNTAVISCSRQQQNCNLLCDLLEVCSYPQNVVMSFLGNCKFRPDRRCTYNVTLWRVRVTILIYHDETNVRLVINYCSTPTGLGSHSELASFWFDTSCYMFHMRSIFRDVHCL